MRQSVAFVWKILHQDKGLRGASQAVVPTSFNRTAPSRQVNLDNTNT